MSASMVLLALFVPFYLFIDKVLGPDQTFYMPALSLDHALPLRPAWSLVYCSLYVFVLLPVFVVHQQEQIRRTVHAYLAVWMVSYVFFLTYPTVAPRPLHDEVAGDGFFVWVLRSIYDTDPPFNCFPSLHVAQCFLSALTCYRVHRGVGAAAGLWAAFVGVSTLYTKQHYVLDAIAGMLLAGAAYAVFLRGYPREAVPAPERRLAPFLALGAVGVYGLVVAGFWLAYALMGA